MVATTDCVEKSKPTAGNKVSKPLMEKKRRARINKCLDQLKSLLESYYSTSIRKRKLEKADILELTVKHLRNLQKIQSCAAAASEFPDYQTGFRSCLANFNQYLLMADNLSGSERWMLAQLSGKLCRSGGREEAFSTLDSGPGQKESQEEARRLVPSAAAASAPGGPEGRKSSRCKAVKPHSANTPPCLPRGDTLRTPGTKQAVRAQSSPEKSPSSPRDEGPDPQQPVWRPW